jgi:hypothetical protein
MDDQVVQLPEQSRSAARGAGAKVIGMPLTEAQCADAFRAWG